MFVWDQLAWRQFHINRAKLQRSPNLALSFQIDFPALLQIRHLELTRLNIGELRLFNLQCLVFDRLGRHLLR